MKSEQEEGGAVVVLAPYPSPGKNFSVVCDYLFKMSMDETVSAANRKMARNHLAEVGIRGIELYG